MGTILGAILALVVGVLLIIWTAHIVLHILGWVLVVAAVVWLVRFLLSSRNNSPRL
jgi:hypothetical protein